MRPVGRVGVECRRLRSQLVLPVWNVAGCAVNLDLFVWNAAGHRKIINYDSRQLGL